MSSARAIVTLALGSEHSRRWHELCEPNWRAYSERHGYDLICLEHPLDKSDRALARSPAWQKLLVLEQRFAAAYERVVWVDADIVFAPGAPDVIAGVPPEKVGAVDELAMPTDAVRRLVHPETTEEYYAAAGLEGNFERIVQTGLLVLSRDHAEFLREVYDGYEDPGPNLGYEMRPLSYELQSRGLVHWLDPRFNCLWDIYIAARAPFLVQHPAHPRGPAIAERALGDVFGLHFAGRAEEMDRLLGPGEPAPAAARRGTGRSQPARSPVLMLVYARPDTTSRVLDAVRAARPSRLLVAADGPQAGDDDEAERCERTRALFEAVDWDCEVSTDFADANLGQTSRIESGLDWAFSQVEEAIVLEDDCVPDPSFFAFCDDLLERYRNDDRVMSISGDNFQFDGPASADSYYFSRYPQIWGWATWRRAWELNDPEMSAWPELRRSGWLEDTIEGPYATDFWTFEFDQNHRDRHAWDYSFLFSCLVAGGLHAIPNSNLVSNVGFREDAIHTTPEVRGLVNDLPTEPMPFPLSHPAEVSRNAAADVFTEQVLYSGKIGQLFDRLRATIREAGAAG
jgi:hypothetical protein